MEIDSYKFHGSLYKVLKQVHPETGITGQAKTDLNKIIHQICKLFVKNIDDQIDQHVEINTVQNAIGAVLSEKLHKFAVNEGDRAIYKFIANKAKSTKISLISGLQMSVSKVKNLINKYSRHDDLGLDIHDIIYITAVLEYLASEILELAGNTARDHRRSRITTDFMMIAIHADEELKKLYRLL